VEQINWDMLGKVAKEVKQERHWIIAKHASGM
jgi:hypothetical protein